MKIYNIYSKRKEYTMPAKASGKIKTSIIRQTQKNGDIYILERQTIYDPEKKYNKVLSTKLISKIPKGSEIPVPTRPKRTKSSNSDKKTEIVSAKRNHVGMMDIIDHIGTVSGIDDASHQPPLQVVVCSGPPRGLCCLLASKAGAASSVTGYRYKAAPSLSSFLDSSDCSLTYFLIASSVTLPIVAT